MKRKRQSNSPKLSQGSSSKMMGNTSSFPNKNPASFKQTNDFQHLGDQLIQLLGAVMEQHIRQNPIAFITLLNKFSTEIITPSIAISNTFQELNLSDKFTYKITRHIGCLRPELITDIHSVFHNNGLTGTPAESFIPHFLGGETKARKIIWLRADNLLTFTFAYLMEKLFPYYDTPFEIMAQHFCDAEGNDYTSERLRKSHSKGVQKMQKLDMIRKAFSPLIKKGDV
jgi:hypothetical protein